MKTYFLFGLTWVFCIMVSAQDKSCIRINQLGYTPAGIKIAVWGSSAKKLLTHFDLMDAVTKQKVFSQKTGKDFGAYGPFASSYRLDFSEFQKPGTYYLQTDTIVSPVFRIDDAVYAGAADFCLQYMRQQRSGFNPFLRDSCHTHDGYTLYGPMPDSTHLDVTGGWHDASDYLQYSTTSANATWHLLAAYQDFPGVFKDKQQANGLEGTNGIPDVLDEARWGLDWLVKMNPRDQWLFNQLGDDRDHMGMRIPKEDNFYGRGFERPVYFINGKPQQRGKFLNATTGAASTAGKFAGAFALGSQMFLKSDPVYAAMLQEKAKKVFELGQAMPGVAQTVSVRSPYIYAEGDWKDDMELGAASLYAVTRQKKFLHHFEQYLDQASVSKWMGLDTASHYQYYPFSNPAVYSMARQLPKDSASALSDYYADGLQKVFLKAGHNAFNRGIPYIWCSNNLTVSFAIECYWYRKLTGSHKYAALEQANFDWLFGCNPWGTSMVYGLPANGDTPVDPHSAFTHLKNYPINGGLVDGPVYTSIYKSLIGIHLQDADEYADWQSDLAVYHDDYGDYSTNEPTMDGTASLIYLLAAKEAEANTQKSTSPFQVSQGAIIRGDSSKKEIAIIFTADEFGDGLPVIAKTLEKEKIQASFFFTGRFYRNPAFRSAIQTLIRQQHYLGPHSDQHLLYCDWTLRDSLLVTRDSLFADLAKNEETIHQLTPKNSNRKKYMIPPYEWWNQAIAEWMQDAGIRLFSFTPGTTSNADYTYPEMGRSYKSSETIIQSIQRFNENRAGGLNGVILLIHAGTDPRRKDKLYLHLGDLIGYLKKEGYRFKTIDQLIPGVENS
ncbi:MAG: glycoside hydrolase family 9 protein [Bacteroidota bacterium]|nr:glycoside hydrolase family 9 protein [Bacteroidota bacterium]